MNQEEMETNGSGSLSRRGFIATAGIGIGALAATTVLASCSSDQKTTADDRQVWDEEYDIVIVGSGGAGFACALSAKETDGDVSIAIYERLPMIGGNSALSSGNYGVAGTDIQKKQGETDELYKDDSPDLYFKEKRKLGGYRSKPELTRIFVDQALDGFNWLNGLGVSFQKAAMYDEAIPAPENVQGLAFKFGYNPEFKDGMWLGCQTKGRHHKSATYGDLKGGSATIQAMSDAANEFGGIDVVTNAQVTEIIREEQLSGEVLGVVIAQGDSTKRVKARKGVVLAAGGFSANTEMCHKFDPRISLDSTNTGCAGVDGQALLMAQDIGADTQGMDFIQPTFEDSYNDSTQGVIFNKRGAFISIGHDGKRFWKETENKSTFRDARLDRLYELGYYWWWNVADSASLKRMDPDPEEFEMLKEIGNTIECQTVDELAAAMGVPAEVLQESLDRWNGFCDAGVDEDFGQESAYLNKVIEPPFYAESRCYNRHSTPGGLCINERTEVLDRATQVIPRLYAIGEITGGVHGSERNGGCSWTENVVFGRIAGKEVASLEPKA
ncbi:FAD-dependent oxidoreductase [Raoultibacter massiliensis]|uniref:FAD-dependent oxidoreductase n=1 Tax=Raoultibacter massiliensis TaxID=1852371 RepID=UPI003A959B6D